MYSNFRNCACGASQASMEDGKLSSMHAKTIIHIIGKTGFTCFITSLRNALYQPASRGQICWLTKTYVYTAFGNVYIRFSATCSDMTKL
jgi:hypothetical protein